jgi:hypothetical protein
MFLLRQSVLRTPFSIAAFASLTMSVSACGGGFTTPATPSSAMGAQSISRATSYTFMTIDNMNDPTFNQLLGINTAGKISGYFGSGMPGHPNKGYTVVPPYMQGNFKRENYPGSKQTQVTAINNKNDTAGFWVDAQDVNRGFIRWNSVFTSYTAPGIGSGTVTQILGLNDTGKAVGFYTTGTGMNFGFLLNQAKGKFTTITPPGATNVTASAINNNGDITGFYAQGTKTIGFLKKGNSYSVFHFPKQKITMPFGINDNDDIVGQYTDRKGATHGFLLVSPLHNAMWTSIDDPNGIGATTINGLNDAMEMVGFYTDTAGNTHGMLITP